MSFEPKARDLVLQILWLGVRVKGVTLLAQSRLHAEGDNRTLYFSSLIYVVPVQDFRSLMAMVHNLMVLFVTMDSLQITPYFLCVLIII